MKEELEKMFGFYGKMVIEEFLGQGCSNDSLLTKEDYFQMMINKYKDVVNSHGKN